LAIILNQAIFKKNSHSIFIEWLLKTYKRFIIDLFYLRTIQAIKWEVGKVGNYILVIVIKNGGSIMIGSAASLENTL